MSEVQQESDNRDVIVKRTEEDLTVLIKPTSEGTLIRITTLDKFRIMALNIYNYVKFLEFEDMWEEIEKGSAGDRFNYALEYMGMDNDIFTIAINDNQAVKIYIESFGNNYVTVVNKRGRIILVADDGLKITKSGTSVIFKRDQINE